jgi:hypothetical protein
VGFATMPFAGRRRERGGEPIAKGLDFDLFGA